MIVRTLTILSLGVVCCVAGAGGPIYKFVDPQGRQHFADQPKAGWTRIDVRTSVAEPVVEEASPETRDQAVTRAADCARKEEQLRTYRNAASVVERDALGREKQYSEEERGRLIAQFEQEVQRCKTPQAPDSVE